MRAARSRSPSARPTSVACARSHGWWRRPTSIRASAWASRCSSRAPEASMHDALLIELLTEELPPKSLQALADAFAERVFALLKEDGLAIEGSRYEAFATPRRLAVLIEKVAAEANDKPITLSAPP